MVFCTVWVQIPGENKAAIDLHCKLNGKLIAALLFIPYGSLI